MEHDPGFGVWVKHVGSLVVLLKQGVGVLEAIEGGRFSECTRHRDNEVNGLGLINNR